MSNIKEWIEAQLKKGYSKDTIKGHLIRKGYPNKVVAEVDKVKSFSLTNKNVPKKLISLSLIIVLVVGLLFFGLKFTAEKDFLSLKEVSKETGFSENYLEQLAKDGKIRSKTEDGTIYISLDDLEEYIQEITGKALEELEQQIPLLPADIPLDEPSADLPSKDFGISIPLDSIFDSNYTPEKATIISEIVE